MAPRGGKCPRVTSRVICVNGELPQVICLCGYGSRWLAQSALVDPPPLDRENSTFQFVGPLVFRLPGGRAAHELQANTVADWLRQLRDRGVARLWLVIPEPTPVTAVGRPEDEQMLAGFANAGRWSIASMGQRDGEIWRATWTVGDHAAPDRRIWSVRYEGARVDQVTPQRPDLASARSDLTAEPRTAQAFAIRQQMETWPA